jgi:hypothetical protein
MSLRDVHSSVKTDPGVETNMAEWAAKLGYFPEILLAKALYLAGTVVEQDIRSPKHIRGYPATGRIVKKSLLNLKY